MPFPPPLDTLTDAESALLNRYTERLTFPAGERIFRAGSPADGCYIIEEGRIRLELERPGIDSDSLDSDNILGYLEPGELLGELSLLDRGTRSASACADTAVTARYLPAAALEELCAREPHLGLAIVRALGRDAALKLRATTARLAEYLLPEAHDPAVDACVARARAAQRAIEDWPEERIDGLLRAVAETVAARAEDLAAAAVRETHLGNVPDKVTKIQVASLGVLGALTGQPASGPLGTDAARGVTEIASPMGVVFGIIPVTNPVATAVYKALICLKARNAVILSFHHACLGVGNATGELIRETLERHGAPGDLVQWIRARSTRAQTGQFMGHPGVALILATGGAGLVKAAYSSGTPAIGVGPGNAPALVCADADPDAAAQAVVLSKSFDNGLICGAEHNLVVVEAIRDRFVAALERAGAAVLSPTEAARFAGAVVEEGRTFRPQIIGQDAARIAAALGIERDHPIRLIVVPAEVDFASPFAGEKIAPVLSLFAVPDEGAGFALSRRLLEHQGAGHTAVIHSGSPATIERFGLAMPASRILANSPAVQGVCGVTSGLEPAFTLGCGTFGGNSTTDNVTYRNLLNIKRLAHYREPATAVAG
ncbi:MAG TPA: aldehyde dehydrogenase family protein [Thermomicrobiales bacterium]|nr:aldehyde dehydrogenase family protein [Thermomicrobiales bacterium]